MRVSTVTLAYDDDKYVRGTNRIIPARRRHCMLLHEVSRKFDLHAELNCVRLSVPDDVLNIHRIIRLLVCANTYFCKTNDTSAKPVYWYAINGPANCMLHEQHRQRHWSMMTMMAVTIMMVFARSSRANIHHEKLLSVCFHANRFCNNVHFA